MSKPKSVISMLTLALVAVMLGALAPSGSHAAAIVRSRSNISNNRSASPIGESKSGPGDVVVLCESCSYPGLPEEGHLILMDNQTGMICAYSDLAVVGQADPKCFARFRAVGQRIEAIKTSGTP